MPVTTGPGVVLQQTPRAVIAAPPFDVMMPPDSSVVAVIAVAAVVESVGKDALTTGVIVALSFLQLKKRFDD